MQLTGSARILGYMADIPRRNMRVSDAERARTAQVLTDALAEGRLTHDEADERLAACWAAKYDTELADLTADLPEPPPMPAPVADGVPAHRPGVWSVPLVVHTALAALISTMLIGRWAADPGGTPGPDLGHHHGFGAPDFAQHTDFFWPIFPIIWLALSVVVHYGIRLRRARRYGD